ncbi:hypothetical protein HPB48_002693 [Haemaphysalis longicornis]|uniref:Uncharacterized protein n=1 Tax=Haemaphysalis longicornis TaxID=44386 RepID=A0A9J6GSM8_HAELO|nr:hypothetical protein HPB48_002693 [Haemaphysalis longicornis]
MFSAQVQCQSGAPTGIFKRDSAFVFAAKNGTSTNLYQKVEILERELESTSALLRQANRELARREASLAQLGRNNELLRGRLVRLETDVAIYRAAASTATSPSSSEEDDVHAAEKEQHSSSPGRCCSARDRELLQTLADIYAKVKKTNSVGRDGASHCSKNNVRDSSLALPDARILEQVFANFWQEYRSMSDELNGCKQIIANQELRMRFLETQVDAAGRLKTSDFSKAAGFRKDVGSETASTPDSCAVDASDRCSESAGCCVAVANVERRVAEESHLLARLRRLQLENNRLQVVNRETLAREAAIKKELQRVQSKVCKLKL